MHGSLFFCARMIAFPAKEGYVVKDGVRYAVVLFGE